MVVLIIKKKKCADIDIITYILNLVKADPFIERTNIKILVLQKINIKISLSKISIIYRKLTWKKPRKYYIKDDSYLIEIQESRRIFKEEIMKRTIKNIVSINEHGFNNLFLHTKGLSERGVKINIPVAKLKENNDNLILAIKKSGIVYHFKTNKNVNNGIFNDIIKELINRLDNNTKHTFIFFNIPFHTMFNIKKLINDIGH